MGPFNGLVVSADLEETNGFVEITLKVPAGRTEDIQQVIDEDMVIRMTPMEDS